MYKVRWMVLLLILLAIPAFAEIRPWVSLSGFWGQGNAGVGYKDKSTKYILKYDYVYDLDDRDFTYHQVTPYIDCGRYSYGVKYRHQLSQDEYAPVVAYFHPWYHKYPLSLYNEVEYRINSVVKGHDYFRSRHIFTIYAPKLFQNRYSIKPYVAVDTFLDWEEAILEKTRLNVGYFKL